MKQYIQDVLLSIKRGFPFVVIETANYQLTCNELKMGLEEDERTKQLGLLHHDSARGAVGLNENGTAASSAMNTGDEPAITTAKLEECLQRALDLLPSKNVLIVDDVHLMLEHKDEVVRALYIQCIRNCRDPFKSSKRVLVFLVPKLRPPVELAKDLDIVVAPMPDEEDRKRIAKEIATAAEIPVPEGPALQEIADTMRGLTAFSAENLLAMSATSDGFNVNILRRGSIAAVNAVAGLRVMEGKMTFDQIAGLEQVKKWGRMKASGKLKPMAVVLIDEMSDQSAGENDSNGINRDARGVMLGAMQDNDWRGGIFTGVAGTGKTQCAGAIAEACECMLINWDAGSMKGGIVSDSERMIRAAVGTLYERFGSRVLFIGTTNTIEEIVPQMKRRFGTIFFFDILSEEQQLPIWAYYQKKFSIPLDEVLPPCKGWTGAEIERCSEVAWEFGIPLVEASQFISPVVMSMGDALDKMREGASGKYLSASYEGYFQTKRGIDTSKMREFLSKPTKLGGNN